MGSFIVIVADSARARIFSRSRKFSPLEEEAVLIHPESRLRRQDLVSDRPGTVHESSAYGESDASQPTDPKRLEATLFAREIARQVQSLVSAGDLEGIILVAEPRFLGMLRSALDDSSTALVVQEVGASLTRESLERIQQRIDH